MATRADDASIAVADMTRVTTFAEVDEVLRSRDFAQAAHQDRDSAPLIKDSLITLHGGDHFTRRRLEAALFTRETLSRYEHEILVPAIERMLQVATETGRGPDGLVRADLLSTVRLALLQMTAAMVGLDGVDTPERAERLRQLAVQIGEGAAVEWSTRPHDEVIAGALVAKQAYVDEYYQASIDERRRRLAARTDENAPIDNDLLTLLLVHFADDWDEDLAIREAILFLVAASNTTTNATPHVVRELSAWLEAHPEDWSRVEDPEFLRAAANEALRLHPPVPALLRKAMTDIVTESGRAYAEGEHVAVDLDAANRDPEVFGPDADEFNPNRRSTERNRPFGFTFGGGTHMCLGRALAVGAPQGEMDEEGLVGVMVRVLRELYRAGVRLDPDAPPQLRPNTEQKNYLSFPVIYGAL